MTGSETLGPPVPIDSLELVDQVDDIEEAATCAIADAGPGDGDGQMGLAGAGPADEHHVALVGGVSRLNDAGQRILIAVPELAIVDDELWQAVKARQVVMTSKVDAAARQAFWDQRRPRYLFSGLMRCGVCGGGFAKISSAHFGYSTARNKGT